MRVAPLPRAGRRRLAEQPAPPAGGVGDVGMKAAHERRPQLSASSTAGGTRATAATTAGRSAAASTTPTRPPRTGPTPRTSTGSSRRRSSRATTTATRRAAGRLARRSCAARWRRRLWRFSTTRMLHEYIERLYLPAVRTPGRASDLGGQRSRGTGNRSGVLPDAVVVDREVEVAAGRDAGSALVADHRSLLVTMARAAR